MQFIDIYSNHQFMIRLPLGLHDLMGIDSGNWEEDYMERARLLEMNMHHFFNEPAVLDMKFKNTEFFLVVESRMNKIIEHIVIEEETNEID